MKFLIRLTSLFWFLSLFTGCSIKPQVSVPPSLMPVFNLNTYLKNMEVNHNVGQGDLIIELSSIKTLHSNVALEMELLLLSNNNLYEVKYFSEIITSEQLNNEEILRYKEPMNDLSLGQYEITVHALTIDEEPDGSKYGELKTIYFTVTPDEILLHWVEYPSSSSKAVKTSD